MSVTATPSISLAAPPSPPPVAARPPRTWLFGPGFDLLFVSNLAWPIIVLLSLTGLKWLTGPMSIVQIYFLSTPHRWITLLLVFGDREHFWQQPRRFTVLGLSLLAFGGALVVAGTYAVEYYPVAGHSLFLLVVVDSTWNAWHFAAQHAGVSRIYGRTVRPGDSLKAMNFEKAAIRLLVLWACFRLALYYVLHDGPAGVGDNLSWLLMAAPWIDPLIVLPSLVLLGREIAAYQPQARGRLAYLFSVITLYIGQVIALNLITPGPGEEVAQQSTGLLWVQALVIGGAIYHATEYLAIVSWSVQRKSAGAWRFLVPRWALFLTAFMMFIGATSWVMASYWIYTWVLINLLVSLLHYGYDGIIWKSKPKPAVAAAPVV